MMEMFFSFLMPTLGIFGLWLFAYGLYGSRVTRPRLWMLAGVLCIFGGTPAALFFAEESATPDPWVCTHTHVEMRCHGAMLHACRPVDVCDEKRLSYWGTPP